MYVVEPLLSTENWDLWFMFAVDLIIAPFVLWTIMYLNREY